LKKREDRTMTKKKFAENYSFTQNSLFFLKRGELGDKAQEWGWRGELRGGLIPKEKELGE